MSYISAEDILPKELIETIQQYVSGKTIYIPCNSKNAWGSQTDTKQYLEERNMEIYKQHQKGISTKELTIRFALSEKSIQRIIRDIRRTSN